MSGSRSRSRLERCDRVAGGARREHFGPSSGERIRIGVSSCLVGEAVRYDGGHKRAALVTDLLSRRFELVAAR